MLVTLQVCGVCVYAGAHVEAVFCVDRLLLLSGFDTQYLRLCLRMSLCTWHRQLEAIVRIAESLAKMRLAAFAVEADVDEALRLFQVSTLDAAMTGSLAGLSVYVIVLLAAP